MLSEREVWLMKIAFKEGWNAATLGYVQTINQFYMETSDDAKTDLQRWLDSEAADAASVADVLDKEAP